MKKVKNFRDLQTWEKGMNLAKGIYAITASFPKEEIYGLTSQIRRAAGSIPSNIAEGFSRRSKREFSRFLHISLSSGSELETQILLTELNRISREKTK